MKLKFSSRERWVLTFLPAVLLLGGYDFGYVDRLYANLDAEEKRVAAASAPLPPTTPPASLGAARKELADARRATADRESRITKLDQKFRALQKSSVAVTAEPDPAQTIGSVEAVFAQNGITALVSEAAENSKSGNQVPAELLAAVAPDQKTPRVWHYIFDNQAPNFEKAVKVLIQKVPGVVPLSFNFVYNPVNDGQSRLLELWLMY